MCIRDSYIPATSKIYLHNQEIVQFERLMVHENRNGVKLYDYVSRRTDVFGENAAIAFCYLLSTLCRDIIFKRTRHFPILNLFGEKGTGKTTLCLLYTSRIVLSTFTGQKQRRLQWPGIIKGICKTSAKLETNLSIHIKITCVITEVHTNFCIPNGWQRN